MQFTYYNYLQFWITTRFIIIYNKYVACTIYEYVISQIQLDIQNVFCKLKVFHDHYLLLFECIVLSMYTVTTTYDSS
jgi:hypothetical protein